MIDLFVRYGVAIHVALMVVYSAWARGGSSPAYVWALPWLSLGLLEIMLLLPPAHRGEAPKSAVRRMIGGILLDPITYIGIALLGFLLVQWLNGPCELVENPEAFSGWDYEPPPWKTLPFCVVREEALQVLLWFVAVVSAVVAVRHAVRPSARYFILKLFVANGALLAILGFAQVLTSHGKLFWYRPISVYFFSTFGYPNHAGTFFVMMTALNIGLLIRAIGNKGRRAEIAWLALAFCLNAAAIYGSLCRAAIVMGSLIIIVGLLYGLIYLWNRISHVKVLAAVVIVAAIAVCAGVLALVPGSPLKKEVDSIDFSHLASVYQGDREELGQAALDIWKDHSWTGVGGWGFRRYVALYMGEDRWEYLQTSGRANVHNDALQFLCEHGLIGFGLIAALAIALLGHALVRLPLIRRETDTTSGLQRSWFGSVSPCVWASFAAIAAMVVHSTIDLPFRSIANTLVWFVLLACLPGFMPSKESSK
jgi:O-antigen ligase